MNRARNILRWIVTAAFVVSLLPIINLNVERLAEKEGWDRLLSAHWRGVFSSMASIAENPIFLMVLGVALGGTLFMWIDYFLRRVEPKYVSPFVGKTQSGQEKIPPRFIEVIDRDDREIANRIRLHAIPKPIRVHRHLEAPDPHLVITVHLWNSSVYELEFVSVTGKFSYKNYPLQNEPLSLNPGAILTRYQAEAIKLQQYVTPHVAEQLREWSECEFTTGNVRITFKYIDRFDVKKTVEFQIKGRCHLVSIQ